MRLTKTAYKQILALKGQALEDLPDHTRQGVQAKLEYLLENFRHITEIEGVKNVSGGKYLVQQRVVEALERLGVTVDDLTLDELAVSSFIEGEPLVG
jgi:acyl-CoA synthetase (NDP forming)